MPALARHDLTDEQRAVLVPHSTYARTGMAAGPSHLVGHGGELDTNGDVRARIVAGQ
jgi:hypothetical protein